MYSQIGGIVPKLGVKAGLLLKIISSFDALFSKFNCLPKPVNCLPVSFGRLFTEYLPLIMRKDLKPMRTLDEDCNDNVENYTEGESYSDGNDASSEEKRGNA